MIRDFCRSCRIQVHSIFFRFPDPDDPDKTSFLCEVCGKLEKLGIIDMDGHMFNSPDYKGKNVN
jgi:hypothetical protein